MLVTFHLDTIQQSLATPEDEKSQRNWVQESNENQPLPRECWRLYLYLCICIYTDTDMAINKTSCTGRSDLRRDAKRLFDLFKNRSQVWWDCVSDTHHIYPGALWQAGCLKVRLAAHPVSRALIENLEIRTPSALREVPMKPKQTWASVNFWCYTLLMFTKQHTWLHGVVYWHHLSVPNSISNRIAVTCCWLRPCSWARW